MAKSHVTISDIATTAGVSKTTVSRYINGQMNLLSKPTTMRIRKAIELTGYRPNATAQALSRGTSAFVGIAVDNIAADGMAEQVRDLAEILQQANHPALIVHLGPSSEQAAQALGLLLSQGVTGIIAVGSIDLENIPATVPSVQLQGDAQTAVDQLLELL